MGNVYDNLDQLPDSAGRVVTVGNFDGFHRGHLGIMNAALERAQKDNLDLILLTFRPHPREVISPQTMPRLLLTHEEEIDVLRRKFPGDILLLRFDESVRQQTAKEFISETLIKRLRMKVLISGENNTLGKDRCGDSARLEELAKMLDFDFQMAPSILSGSQVISSTLIRKLISEGEIDKAKQLLVEPYYISGEVIRGLGLGRKMGYPTANLDIMGRKLLPKQGVYAAYARVNEERFGAMMFVGVNHLDPDLSYSVEANILDFDRDIYGEVIFYEPLAFIRENRAIRSSEELIRQIKIDKKNIEEELNKEEKSSVC